MDMGKVKIAQRKVCTAQRFVGVVCSLLTGWKARLTAIALQSSSEKTSRCGPLLGCGLSAFPLSCISAFVGISDLILFFSIHVPPRPPPFFATVGPLSWEYTQEQRGIPRAGFWAGVRGEWKCESKPCFVPFELANMTSSRHSNHLTLLSWD